MDTRKKFARIYLTTAGLSGFLCVSVGRAAAPSPAEIQVKHISTQQLDLRLPEVASGTRLEGLENKSSEFTRFSRRDLASIHAESVTVSDTASASSERTLSRTEVLANQFRRQGLPVARLWENNSTLVHLGLNQKGKPGLWVVQKIR